VNDKAVVFLPWDTIEKEAQQQILNTASMPFVFRHVAVMPDCHYGKGATVETGVAGEAVERDVAAGLGGDDERVAQSCHHWRRRGKGACHRLHRLGLFGNGNRGSGEDRQWYVG